MNIIIDRPQLVRVVLLYLNMNFGNLIPKTYTELILYVNSDIEVMMKYNKKNGIVFIDYTNIWSKIESLFSLDSSETQSIMRVWLAETYDLRRVTPTRGWI
jgi:hypothetical protein